MKEKHGVNTTNHEASLAKKACDGIQYAKTHYSHPSADDEEENLFDEGRAARPCQV